MKNDSKIKVLIADRDSLYMHKVKSCLEKRDTISVIGMVDSGDDVLSLVKAHNPDVLLLDVLLIEKDGFWALENLRASGFREMVCIIISAIDSDNIVRKAMALGADYYMAKPIQSEVLMERIEQLLPQKIELSNFSIQQNDSIIISKEIEIKSGNLESEISNLLNRMGISASIKGYHYIRKAVMMAVDDEEVLIGITKGLYPDIGKFYHTTSSKVERAIRHAIESAWKKNGSEVFTDLSGYFSQNKPTNGQFIAFLSEYYRLSGHQNHRKTA